ncbi:MAG TPA: hypothetical protein PLB52_04320 [Candidatus Moranbacteria bacterium]|nr:hypothetical protein [Candidatus Moranbacteria bacterium]
MKNAFESFLWGIIAALGALVLEIIAFLGISYNKNIDFSFSVFFSFPFFILIAAGIEEFFKYIIISKKIESFSLEKSYIVNSLLVGLGFFAVELELINISSGLPNWNILSEIALLHIGTAGIIGYIVAIKNPRKFFTFLFALSFAVAFHAAYNFLVIKRAFLQNYAVFCLLGLIILINIVNFFRISGKINPDSK